MKGIKMKIKFKNILIYCLQILALFLFTGMLIIFAITPIGVELGLPMNCPYSLGLKIFCIVGTSIIISFFTLIFITQSYPNSKLYKILNSID
jgi:hypothetical protein